MCIQYNCAIKHLPAHQCYDISSYYLMTLFTASPNDKFKCSLFKQADNSNVSPLLLEYASLSLMTTKTESRPEQKRSCWKNGIW